MKNGWRIALGSIALLGLAAAQQLGDLSRHPVPRVAAAPVSVVSVRAGSTATVHLPFRVAPGFHINSHQPGSELLIPTVLHMDPPTDIAIAKVEYPAGKELSFDFAPEEKLNVYAGEFDVSAMVRPTRNTSPGRYRVRGNLKYQACDDRACYPPAQVPIAFDVQVQKAPATRRARRNPPASPHIHQ
ncbi:MAG TPA: protein-disulfide reductase DsbD domain-containing protein [Terriglobales bacterium]|nr:protein-disulfide reductase DsbD domain-containing protein [Terriglobales bacterium]